MGGSIGAELKYAGFDALIITGKSSKKSYVRIENDNIEIRDATHIWGKSPHEVTKILQKDDNAKVASIGKAGENLVRFACVDCENRQAGRTGIGAVMGSKNLKAIAVIGDNDIEVAYPDILKKLVEKWYYILREGIDYEEDTKYGTGEFFDWVNKERGVMPTCNWKKSVFESSEKLTPYYWVQKYVKKNIACFSCMKPCGKLFIVDDGKYKCTVVGPEYETLYSLGAVVGNSNIEVLAKANELCDFYGLDTISTGVTIAFAMDLYEHGILTKKDTNLDLEFGNGDVLLQMIEQISERKGLGDILAEGTRIASEIIGKNSEKYAIHVKGLELPGYDVRALKGTGLGFAVSPRGACHLRSCVYAVDLTGKFWIFHNVNRLTSMNKGKLVKDMEDFMAVYDCLGICKFSRRDFLISFSEIMYAVFGDEYTSEQLLEVGERVNNLKRLFNIREGFTRVDDTLPHIILTTPIQEGSSKNNLISRTELTEMIDGYYHARGWTHKGIPTTQKLRRLDIETKNL
jgi:aldehyde:ferredoxin oxidoreductase